ncbi:MAG: transglutaminase domain-containing protein [Deltaproteobacteria bacterium]|nr:transglutaminase domain-containing protein [Deltaproteobacteria bacterium]
MNILKTATAFFLFTALFASECRGTTLVLEGSIDGAVEVSQERTFAVGAGGIQKLTFRFANPSDFSSPFLKQTISAREVGYSPRPDSVAIERDGLGNAFTVVTWTGLKSDASVTERYTVMTEIELGKVTSAARFPIAPGEIPPDAAPFLKPAPLVQSGDREIRELALRLSSGASTEQGAVMSVLNWVVDNVKYRTPIPNYDALWTLKTGEGNCQNFAHLSVALLRSIGIPARVVGGLSLGKRWKVPLEKGALLQGIGQGGHAWMEVWYPDLGWVPYDAQQSHLFVGPRHIRQAVGLDSNDINDTWRASPSLPLFREDVGAEYRKDDIKLSLKETRPFPVNYIMAASKTAAVVQAPPPPPPPPVKPPLDEAEPVEFGNTQFPSLIEVYAASGAQAGRKTFDKETAEYVTGDYAYAQAFVIDRPMRVDEIALAMHKFGGRLGSLWIDVVRDDNGRPGMEGVRSLPLSLDTVQYYPGYKWFPFIFSRDFAGNPVLAPGRHWIILRHTKDAVVGWFYTPGNQWGPPDDARSTASGIDWSYVMNLDFNFKVRGIYRPGRH